MSKPVHVIDFQTLDGKNGRVMAVFDTGSQHTLIRESSIPADANIIRSAQPKLFGVASQSGQLRVIGGTIMTLTIFGHPIEAEVLVSPDLRSEFLLGAGAMQAWDITIQNENGRTNIIVGRDMNSPEIQVIE